jgi:hypothetical protein
MSKTKDKQQTLFNMVSVLSWRSGEYQRAIIDPAFPDGKCGLPPGD